MPEIKINFDWVVDDAGYDFVPANPSEGDVPRGRIVRRGGNLRLISPISLHKSLFMEFSCLAETPEACIDFANRFGMMEYPDVFFSENPQSFLGNKDKIGEEFDIWVVAIRQLRWLVEEHSIGLSLGTVLDDIGTRTSVYVNLVHDPHDGLIKLNLTPGTLDQALILQFFQAATSGRDHIQCASPRCGKWFEVGPGGKRRGAKTCSDRCRYDLNNIARAEKHGKSR
jgi:hypothetical protein